MVPQAGAASATFVKSCQAGLPGSTAPLLSSFPASQGELAPAPAAPSFCWWQGGLQAAVACKGGLRCLQPGTAPAASKGPATKPAECSQRPAALRAAAPSSRASWLSSPRARAGWLASSPAEPPCWSLSPAGEHCQASEQGSVLSCPFAMLGRKCTALKWHTHFVVAAAQPACLPTLPPPPCHMAAYPTIAPCHPAPAQWPAAFACQSIPCCLQPQRNQAGATQRALGVTLPWPWLALPCLCS